MKRTYGYQVVFTEHDNGEIVVTFPDVPEAITSASTIEQAYVAGLDALKEALLTLKAHGRPLPQPTEFITATPSLRKLAAPQRG